MNEKHYELSILPLFEDDLNEIVDYITYRLRNPLAAEHLVDEVERAIEGRLEIRWKYAASFTAGVI